MPEVTNRTRLMPLKDVLEEIDFLIHEVEDTYSAKPPDSDERRQVARRLVALGIARRAVEELQAKDQPGGRR